MGIKNLITNQLNQNGYSTNTQTREKIGALFTFPIDYTPSDCLSCDGFVLKIIDYKQLYLIIGKKFNKGTEKEDEFRIPDYNISKRFLQPGNGAGKKIEAGIPDHVHTVTALYWDANGIVEEGRGRPDYAHQLKLTTSKASASNAIYGKSTTVQPPSQLVHICIKYI
mgnify:CR=1 FL=1